MADIFHLDKEQRRLVDLLDMEDNLSSEERAELDQQLSIINEKKSMLLPPLFDVIEYLTMQNNHASEKIEEIRKLQKRNERVIDRINNMVKHIFISTGQSVFQIGQAVFKTRKKPPRLDIVDPDAVPEDYKTINITVPMHTARIIALEHPELNLSVDDKKAEIRKSELKDLWKQGIEVQGVNMVNDDFSVEVKGVK
jgi:hypothetical protein